VLTLCAALGSAAFVLYRVVAGKPVEGWAVVLIAVMAIGGVQMLMLGVLGEYVWRTLDEARHRPRYTIESATTGVIAPDHAGTGHVRP
jgi:dolichol-phosphate mannosyltransferase